MALLVKNNPYFSPMAFTLNIHVIGCGGMGSRVAEGLIRMGLGSKNNPIILYDDDRFEEKNLSNQFLFANQINHLKVAALEESLRAISPDLELGISAIKVKDRSNFSGVVFMCLDDMDARAAIMENCLEENRNVKAVFETRVDAGVGVTTCFDPNNIAHQECWWSHWYPEKETENIAGCGGAQPIISAIFGTTMQTLKHVERFSRRKSAIGIPNRVYEDFDSCTVTAETWPTHLDQFGFAT